jgi:hypothetical protein
MQLSELMASILISGRGQTPLKLQVFVQVMGRADRKISYRIAVVSRNYLLYRDYHDCYSSGSISQ